MAKMRVGFVGWRGMVGSVLMQRMMWEHDFIDVEPHFFSTSNVGGEGPSIAGLRPSCSALCASALACSTISRIHTPAVCQPDAQSAPK